MIEKTKMKTKLYSLLIGAIALVGFTGSASAITLEGPSLSNPNPDYYVGYINDGIPSDESREAGYINDLTSLAAGTGNKDIGTETYNRVGGIDGPFATATSAGSYKYDLEDGDTNTQPGFGGFQYILAKYNAKSAGSLVWYFEGGLPDDTVTVPLKFNGKGVSHITGFNKVSGPPPPPPPSVPDGGSTLILFSLALVGLGLYRSNFFSLIKKEA